MKVLGRGYALAQTDTGEILKNAAQLQPGQSVTVQLEQGGFRAAVTEILEANDGTAEHEL